MIQAFRSETMEPLARLVQCAETLEIVEVQVVKYQENQFLWQVIQVCFGDGHLLVKSRVTQV